MVIVGIIVLFVLFFNYAVFRVAGNCSRIEEKEEDN